MLRALELTNFKCFAQQRIELGAVTLLAGQNGMGKSTVLQSLLLIQQSDALTRAIAMAVEQDEENAKGFISRKDAPMELRGGPPLVLNGQYVSSGTSRDLLCESANRDTVAIKVQWVDRDDGEGNLVPSVIDMTFDASGHDRDTMTLGETTFYGPDLGIPFRGRARYLAAERIGPRMSHAVSAYHVDDLDAVGHDGAYAVAFLESHAGDEVEVALRRHDAPAITLAEQVSAWMTEISPGIRLHTQQVPEVNAAALSVSFTSGVAASRRFRPTSVGFGISYTLPVVVTLLAARPGTLLLIENPEAHLHPRGQMALGELIARAGAAGIQVIVETHSDHVVNGVRLAVKDKKIAADQVKFNYFTRRDEGDRLVHEVVSPRIDADGRLDQWPDGFFDQWDLALERLI